MIKVTNLVRRYGDFTAIDQVSFEIKKGEIVGLLGHNGAGKTTIMKVLTGYLEQCSGEVKIKGLDIADDLITIQEKIGYLPENVPLYPEMTILDYLEYVADLRGINPEDRVAKISKAVKRTNLQSKALNKIETLSKGFKQRVGVAQAILHEPEILILDEPTNGLDPSQIQEMRHLIKDLAVDSTIILSTHIMQEVEAVCDRVLIIQQGKLVLDSTMDEIKSSGGIILSVDRPEREVEAQFAKMSGVQSVRLLNKESSIYSYLLTPQSGTDHSLLADISNRVLSSGWRLYTLTPREQSLDSVFRSLNHN